MLEDESFLSFFFFFSLEKMNHKQGDGGMQVQQSNDAHYTLPFFCYLISFLFSLSLSLFLFYLSTYFSLLFPRRLTRLQFFLFLPAEKKSFFTCTFDSRHRIKTI